MITIRPSDARGEADHGWLKARHTFSFSDFHDPQWMGYSNLRVINEDRVAPGAGFAPHGHRDMEIITYVLQGALRHRDSTGGWAVLPHGELQVMTAGTGIRHSEMNASQSDGVHLLQIWIVPDAPGGDPGYQQKRLDEAALRKDWSTVVAPVGEKAPFSIRADARLAIAWPAAGQRVDRPLDPKRRYFLQVATGAVTLDGRRLAAGDAALLEGESRLPLAVESAAELLLFDLP
ncbi:MAG TPA: pirin family protein [Nevskiaceae bacterium]|nr:pirin family protein [Nevskiaceae bacterium]